MKEACAGSADVEVSKDGLMVRRKGNKALPAQTGSIKKRDAKAASKQTSKVEENKENEPEEEIERDDQGRIIFKPVDFEDPKIIHFITHDRDAKKDENYKVNWKDLEVMVKEKFDKLKVVYSRADKYEGDLAISQHKLCKEQFDKIASLKDQLVGDKKFTFTLTEGEELKEFWQKQGGHYQFCIAPK